MCLECATQDVTMNPKTAKDNTSSEVHHDQQPENWTKLSLFLHVFLPVTGLLILFRQKQFFSKLLLQFDRNCVSVFCPSLSRREKLLKWAGSRLPETWSSPCKTLAGGVAELWSDGSLLCTLINSAIPGACPNPHRHWKKPPLHAQAIAYKYLGVIPIFTENELKGDLTVSLERNFLHYLNELQQAIIKLSEKDDLPKSISLHYVVRGMGLYSGEQHRKAVFYVYPNTNTTGLSSNIIVHIRGPYATYGKAIIPKFHNDLFSTPEISITSDLLTTKKLLNGKVLTPRNSFINGFSLPFMQYHKKHMGDNIVIDVTMEDDRAKVTYIPKNYGMYEIIMISNGELIRGCPFNVHILNNVSGIEDCLDGNEKVEDIPSLRKRKILSKTIDFIDKQMPVEDVFKSFTYREEKVENHILYKNTKNKTKIEEGNIKENKGFEEVPTIPEKDMRITKSNKETEEGGSKDELEKENDDPDKLSLIIEDTPTEKKDSILEKQNSESTNEKSEASDRVSENNLVTDNKLNENSETRGIIHKVNCYADNRKTHKVVDNDILVSLQLKSTSDSTNDDKKTTDVLDQSKQTDSTACNTNHIKISEINFVKSRVKKIKIPEKFCEIQNVTDSDGLDMKFFKNVINTNNKKDLSNNTPTDFYKSNIKNYGKDVCYLQGKNNFPLNARSDDFKQYDNNNNNLSNLNHSDMNSVNVMHTRNSDMDTRKIKVVPNRFLQNQQHLQNLESPTNNATNTSPICPDHIVPEVENEYLKLSVAEKRKIFSNHVQDRISTSTNSSFSENENAEAFSNRPHFRQFEGLSVLNYLGSLKKSEYSKNHESFPLCNAVSLPNISSSESNVFHNTVKARASFWEKISSSSSSLSVNSELSPKRQLNRLTETERCRLIWKKPVDTTTSSNSINTIEESRNVERNAEIRKSADDILSITNCIPRNASKKYKSMDHSLDKCTMMSIEERKKMLLKKNYEIEIPRKPSIEILRSSSTKQIQKDKKFVGNSAEINNVDESTDHVVFSSIWDRIKKYDSVTNLSKSKSEKVPMTSSCNITSAKIIATTAAKNKSSITPTSSTNNNHEDAYKSSQTEILTVKSHFKRAIKYFKNLEQKSLNKSETNSSQKYYRRYSLDLPPSKSRNHARGGSLNLPNIAQRFSVNNLYEDVFGDRRGSFRGAANRSALVEALATFSRKENSGFREDEDTIMYEMFQRQRKTKRRKSIKSIFDIYY